MKYKTGSFGKRKKKAGTAFRLCHIIPEKILSFTIFAKIVTKSFLNLTDFYD